MDPKEYRRERERQSYVIIVESMRREKQRSRRNITRGA
jgi:hypothetical protein